MARTRKENTRVHYTIDKQFDGEEGAIFWYCQMIDGKVYPIQVKYPYFETTIPSNWSVYQIDYFYPYMFILFKDLNANTSLGTLWMVRVDNPTLSRSFNNIIKYDFIEIQNKLHFIVMRKFNDNKIYLASSPLNDDLINRNMETGYDKWFSSKVASGQINLIDFSIYNNRIILLCYLSSLVFYYSKFFLSSVPVKFFHGEGDLGESFTFEEYFFVPPPHQRYVLYRNFFITNVGVYKIEEQEVGGVFQLVPVKILDLTLDFSRTNFQFNILGGGLSTQTHTYEFHPQLNIHTNFFVPTFLSKTAYPVIKNQIYSSCFLENKRRIDYSVSKVEKMILAGEGLYREVKISDTTKKIQVFYLDRESPYILDGKLIFISAFRDYINLKYLKRIKVRRFKDLYDMEGYTVIQDIKVPEFPIVPQGIITEEEQEIEPENPANLRQVGKYFFIEIKPIGGILPVLEVEYDRGR
jgi:hypothetical protein